MVFRQETGPSARRLRVKCSDTLIEWKPSGARSRDGQAVVYMVTVTWSCRPSICILKFHFPVFPFIWYTVSLFLFLSLSLSLSLCFCLPLPYKPNEYRGIRRPFKMCAISGFRLEVDEICALLRYYSPHSGNSLPTFRVNLSVPSSGVNTRVVPKVMSNNFL